MVTEQDLAQLRRRVTQLEGQVAFLYKHLGVTFVPEPGPDDDPRIVEQLQRGNMIEAIKLYREITEAGLAEAKLAVEEIQRRLGM